MYKNNLKLVIIILLMLSLVACGKNDSSNQNKKDEAQNPVVKVDEEKKGEDQETTEDDEYSDFLVVGETIEKGDKGKGPEAIESRMGLIIIPEGLDYELYNAPYSSGKTASIRVDFGKDDTSAGYIEISTTRMIKSLDDAVDECISTNDFGTMESEIGEEITYGDKTFKEVTIKKADDSDIRHYLVYYYEAEDGWDGYVEVHAAGEGHYYNIDINDPLIGEILKALVVK